MNNPMNSLAIANLGEKVSTGWGHLAERDRKTLVLATPVVLLLLLYLVVFQPLLSRYQDARLYKEQLSETLVWLYENAPLVERLQNSCSRQRLISSDGQDLIGLAKNIGSKAGAKPDIRSANASDLVLAIKNVEGNRALASIQSYVCHGYLVSDLELTRTSKTATKVDLNFKLSPSSLLGES